MTKIAIYFLILFLIPFMQFNQKASASLVDEIVVTDTIPLSKDALGCKKIRQLSIAELLAETMRRISEEESVSSLYLE